MFRNRFDDPGRSRRAAWLLLIVAVATACVVLRVPAGRRVPVSAAHHPVHVTAARPPASAVAGSVARESH